MRAPNFAAYTEAPPAPSAALEDYLATNRRWLYMPDPGHALVSAASVVANRAPGDPVWPLLVGSPGCGKTEVLGQFAGLPDCHPAATLTEASLLSGTPKKEAEAAGGKGGLLRTIGPFGIIILKDFGSVLSMHRDSRASLLAALREIYDGAWTRHLGSDGGKQLHWAGKVGLIAGCTPAIDSHHAVMGSMGERFVLYRMPEVDGAEQARRALARGQQDNEMRADLARAARRLLEQVDPAHVDLPLTVEEVDRLVGLAELAARARSSIDRDAYTREIELIPAPEAPARIALVLRRLLGGLVAIGTPRSEAWRLVAKMALDSLPAVRQAVLRQVMMSRRPVTTKEVGEALGYPTTTARRSLEDLAAHHVIERNGSEGVADLWEPNAWTVERWRWTVPETSGPTYS